MSEKEPTLLIVAPRSERRRGRPALFGARAERRIEVRLTDEQRVALNKVAAAEKRDLSAVVRDAVNEYVADYGERRVFVKPKGYQPE